MLLQMVEMLLKERTLDCICKRHAKKMAGVFEAIPRVEYMLLQMVEMLLKERTLDCICKKRHAKKMAGVFEAIRRVEYHLCCSKWSRCC